VSVHRPKPLDVWAEFHDQIDIDRSDLDDYLANADASAILRVNEPVLWQRPVPLSELRETAGLEPPQSFRYLSAEQASQLKELGGAERTPDRFAVA
jgi:predicted transcriptional regulator